MTTIRSSIYESSQVHKDIGPSFPTTPLRGTSKGRLGGGPYIRYPSLEPKRGHYELNNVFTKYVKISVFTKIT